jgi:hypothetical protein
MADQQEVAFERLFELFRRLSELDKQELMRAAGVNDTRPSILRRGGGEYEPGRDWVKRNSSKIAPLLLRWIDADDDDAAILVSGELLRVGRTVSDENRMIFNVRFSSPYVSSENYGIPLNELTANAVAMNQLILTLIAANRPFGASMIMPDAEVSAGSTTFSLVGPGVLGFGLTVMAACAAGVIAVPVAWPVYLTGGILAATGAIETAHNWRKTVADIKKTEREVRKIDDEHGLRDLQKSKLEWEIEKLREDVREARERRSPPPASSLVPLEQVKQAAGQADVDVGYAHHVLNRLLPVLSVISREMPGVTITVEEPQAYEPPVQ